MIHIDNYFMSSTLELTTSLLGRRGNSKQFPLEYFIVNLIFIHFAWMKCNSVQTTITLQRKDSASCKIWRVTFYNARKVRVKMSQDWFRSKLAFQLFKCLFTFYRPEEFLPLFCYVGWQTSELCVALSALSIDICDAQTWLKVLYSLWCILFQYCLHFFLVHYHAIGRNNTAQTIDLRHVPCALLRCKRQLVFLKMRQYTRYQCYVARLIFGIDKNVIQLDDNTKVDPLFENLIHHILKSSQRISSHKWHYQIFEMTIERAECCLPFLAFFTPDIIISRLTV